MKSYLDFLQYCLNPELPMPKGVGDIDWVAMSFWAEQQVIVGVVFSGIEGTKAQSLFHEMETFLTTT